jgi:hypothetical protein
MPRIGEDLGPSEALVQFVTTAAESLNYRTEEQTGVPSPGSPARQPRWGGKGAARLGGGSDRVWQRLTQAM